MNNDKIINEYQEYQDKIGSRLELYRVVSQKFDISSALYPGCHIDLSPSLVIPNVVYVDNFKGTINFFKHINQIKAFINEHKEYKEECEVLFFGQDYTHELVVEPVDLIISQYAGFVGQATKEYLKVGGILLCNDSHGDATLAKFDDDFRLVGTIDEDYEINHFHLEDYFVRSEGKPVDLMVVKTKMKGPSYSKSAANYLFQKIK
ncbi:MAG: hypothetical protein JXR88_18570 [Clostridia bacterium]|nr:hypothetical protein [Clostridia bacterium]